MVVNIEGKEGYMGTPEMPFSANFFIIITVMYPTGRIHFLLRNISQERVPLFEILTILVLPSLALYSKNYNLAFAGGGLWFMEQ